MKLASLLIALVLAAPALVAAQAPDDDQVNAQDTTEEASDDAASDDASDGGAASDDASDGGAASEDAASGDAGDEGLDAAPSEADSEGAVARRASSDPYANVPRTSASGVLGIVTILAAVGTVAGIGFWVEREDNIARCGAYELEEPRYRGCLNVGAIRDQRDVGAGLAIGFGALTLGAAIAWTIVAVTAPPPEGALVCAPGVLSLGCAGRF